MDAAVANGLAHLLSYLLSFFQLVVIFSVVVSWVNADPYNPIVNLVYRLTEPIYKPIRRYTSKFPGPLDWAPLIVIGIIIFIDKSLVHWLMAYARSRGAF